MTERVNVPSKPRALCTFVVDTFRRSRAEILDVEALSRCDFDHGETMEFVNGIVVRA